MKKWVLLLIFLISLGANAQVVLIDPGHGGEEKGAIGKLGKQEIFEKDLSLDLAKLIYHKIKPFCRPYLTRSIDRTVTLFERSEMAEKIKADIVISVHFNSSTDHKAHGVETYYLDNSSDAAVKKLEGQENQSMGSDDESVNQILIDLVIQQTTLKAQKLAYEVHRQISRASRKFKIRDRGTKGGLFHILALSKRPGLLLEAGFISNPKELEKIKSKRFLETYAEAVSQGIKQYLTL